MTRRRREGVILYFALGLLVVLAAMGSMLWMLGQYEELSSEQVYRSEALTAMAESVLEECFYQITDQLNIKKNENKIYFDVREATHREIKIDGEYLKRITPNSRKMLSAEFKLDPEKDIQIQGRICNIESFDVKGFTDLSVRDRIEKNGTLEIEVYVRWQDYDKVVQISRPFKVVKVTMPVLSECTLFLNNGQPDYFGVWSSVYGYNTEKFPESQTSLVLDNGWHGYAKRNRKSDFIKRFNEDILEHKRVPPGRVFINKGIVPMCNGDRASGALQKTFYSGDSEFLPGQMQLPIKAIMDQIKKLQAGQGAQPPVPTTTGTQPGERSQANNTAPSALPTASPSPTASPESHGDLFIRYAGHGEELKKEKISLGNKSWDGFANYFGGLPKGAWASGDKSTDPGLSGLHLYGRVTEKEKGSSASGGGFFAQVWNAIKKLTNEIMSKLYAQYDIRISPTLVYGDVVATYFPIVDYVETGWMEKMKNTASLNPNQTQLPSFPDGFLEKKSGNDPISHKDDLPGDWPDPVKTKWLKLPPEFRTPEFHLKLNKSILSQPSYGLPNDFLSKIPAGAMFAPYNDGLLNFLNPEKGSVLKGFFDNMAARNQFFLKNETDRQIGSRAGCFWQRFSLPLVEFNPFLFYVKATDYMSSLTDPRDHKNLFYEKYMNKKEKCLDLKGVIYITGTEDLVFGRGQYRGKCLIITFGRVIFTGFMIKKPDNDKPDDTDVNANLTIISLGGVIFDTSERIDAQIYSYIYPPEVTKGHQLNLYGGLGCNVLELGDKGKIPLGGEIVFDYTYHIPLEFGPKERDPYYYVAITNEISRYGYSVRRDPIGFQKQE